MEREIDFELSPITDEDICRATSLLNLPIDAFYGKDGSDPRQKVLKCMGSVDVAACPGSGKTTLLVAKLAILADKWKYGTRGICVISHTNAARYEIEKHLGNTAAGQRLLRYPHYIGTIHGFINEFLAVPWLRSRGYEIKMIDTDVCRRRRWMSLPFKTRLALENNHHSSSVLSVKDHDFGVGQVRWGKGQLGVETSTYKEMRRACSDSATAGYFCFDEMFMWAEELIGAFPQVISTLRERFPILFIDEAQDNSKEQSEILSRIFMEGPGPITRQRFGDANQAIFDSIGAEEAVTDKFPGANKVALPNSHRFSQAIASIADPLGLVPYGLQGLGPRKILSSGAKSGKHTIFLFDDKSATKVLEAYAELLFATFSDLELSECGFTAFAVGQVHRAPIVSTDNKFPHHIGDYWPDYSHELAKQDSSPSTFMQNVFSGQARTEGLMETYALVEKIAEGFLRLSDFAVERKSLIRPKQKHRYILTLLKDSPSIREQYLNLIFCFSVKQEIPTSFSWRNHWCKIVRVISETIAGSSLSTEADEFLMWNTGPTVSAEEVKSRNNIYHYQRNGRQVYIQAGSIHSVKGQTHAATLVLETFFRKHNFEALIPWLTQKKHGWNKSDSVGQKDRLKLHYVAMTRPTHLLCLAIKQSVVDENDMVRLQSLGWQLVKVKSEGYVVSA